MNVYMQSQVAEILRMPLALVKNWTIGRPITINPALPAHGSGSRNLYSNNDLYKLALVRQLYKDGLRASVIQRVLDEVGDHIHSLFLVLLRSSSHNGGQLEVVQIPTAQGLGGGKRRGLISGYVLNVAVIKDETDRHIAEFWDEKQRAFGSYQ